MPSDKNDEPPVKRVKRPPWLKIVHSIARRRARGSYLLVETTAVEPDSERR